MENINKYSNPKKVNKIAKKLLGKDVKILLSTRKNKKYMVLDPKTNKFVHFGSLPFEDYTKHNDLHRLQKFLSRNWKWALYPEYSPAWLSYYLLWNMEF